MGDPGGLIRAQPGGAGREHQRLVGPDSVASGGASLTVELELDVDGQASEEGRQNVFL